MLGLHKAVYHPNAPEQLRLQLTALEDQKLLQWTLQFHDFHNFQIPPTASWKATEKGGSSKSELVHGCTGSSQQQGQLMFEHSVLTAPSGYGITVLGC